MTPILRKTLFFALIIAIAAVLAMGLSRLKPETPRRELNNLPPLVNTFELRQSAESFVIESQGTVRPRTETVLSAEISGTIVEISPKMIAGGVFAKDEVLMRVDPANYTVAVERAEALLQQRQIEFDGAAKLRTQGYRAETELAAAAAALASAKADLVSARRNLERSYIRLPYEGMIRSKEADIGQFVSPGTRLGVAFATDTAEVRLPLTDRDLAFVEIPSASEIAQTGSAKGPAVILRAVKEGEPAEWQARIVRSEGVVDEKSRVTYVVAQVLDPYRLHSDGVPLPVGTFVSASIRGITKAGVIRVPRGAVRGANELLMVDHENRIMIRAVDVLRADSEFAYVGAGVSAGDRVVTTSIEAPTDGMLVRTSDTNPPGPGSGEAIGTTPAGQ